MKKLFILFVLSFACFGTFNAQTNGFAPLGAEWYFDVFNPWSSQPEYTLFYVNGDTTIQGHHCSVIQQSYNGMWNSNWGIGHEDGDFVYHENNKVYWFNPTTDAFTILYDFNAEVGDTWYCDVDSCSYLVTVVSVDSVNWEGHTYRTQRVRSFENNIEAFNGQIIEGIGYEKGLFPNDMACHGDIVFDIGEIEYLRCYSEDGDILYHEGDFDCDQTYPNPFCWDGSVADGYAGGDGTEENPYQIANAEQLALLAQQTNNGTGGDAYYKQTKDISLENCTGGYNEWTSIGNAEHPFTGHFDGRGWTVFYLYQCQNTSIKGLFGCTNGAEIKRAHLALCEIGNESDYAGGLVGYAGLTTVLGCSIRESNVISTEGCAGGLVGYMGMPYGATDNGTDTCFIVNCHTFGGVSVNGYYAGGFFGESNDVNNNPWTWCVVRNCDNRAAVEGNQTGSMDAIAGGIGGCVVYTEIEDCVNYGSIQMNDGYAGGIAGSFVQGNISRCENHGSIHNTRIIGGVVGVWHTLDLEEFNTGVIRGCHNYGLLSTGTDGDGWLGGIVGVAITMNTQQRFYIVDCTNQAEITCFGEIAGGIIGNNMAITCLLNVYNKGDVFSYDKAGGLLGYGLGVTMQNAYNVGTINSNVLNNRGSITSYYAPNDTIKDCYWLANDEYGGVGNGQPLLQSCAFNPTEIPTVWQLDSLHYDTNDLVEALNAGAETVENQYPEIAPVCRWQQDVNMINGGFPIMVAYEEQTFPLIGSEWYYEIINANGSVTYQYLQCVGDTAIAGERPKIIVRTNTIYDDKNRQQEVTHEYVFEQDGIVYWWNEELQEFTTLYNLAANEGDEWEIKVGTESLIIHVDAVLDYDHDGQTYWMLRVSDANELFSGDIVCGIGHLTSFFPERLMNRDNDYRVEGIRCYWQDGELMFKLGESDCDEVYQEYHNHAVDETETEGFLLHPNPASSILVITNNVIPSSPNINYFITNLLGQTLLTGQITSGSQQIDVESLPAGMYFITLGNQTLKFTKQ